MYAVEQVFELEAIIAIIITTYNNGVLYMYVYTEKSVCTWSAVLYPLC